ncbi:MarR family winged helix-turn-helix transcriptional regulator [Agromyces silvae]|uniref:MarR family winged helix-turn-helix transcriptional regulator n=1 Tax=Agromyces silvae TaxID=3388266 RepID=UPI00280A84CE|nr:hypothetical protein [Agromyces protaetiae]
MTSDQQIPEPEHHDEPTAPTEATEADVSAGGRPFGFWLKLVDRRLSEEIERVLADDDLTRREWRALNLLAGTARDEHLAAKLEAKPGLVHGLAERGWVEGTPPTLTPAGREALDRLSERVGAVRARVAHAVSPEDLATTVATLEAIARELGWDESQPMPRGRRGGRGFGRRHGGFGGHGRFGAHGRFGGHGFGERDFGGHGLGERGFGERDFGERGEGEHFDSRERFGTRSRFGHGPRHPRQDVHVHVHVHDGHRRPHHDA